MEEATFVDLQQHTLTKIPNPLLSTLYNPRPRTYDCPTTVSSKATSCVVISGKLVYLPFFLHRIRRKTTPRRGRRGAQDSSVANSPVVKKKPPPKNSKCHPRRQLCLEMWQTRLLNLSRMTMTLKKEKTTCDSTV